MRSLINAINYCYAQLMLILVLISCHALAAPLFAAETIIDYQQINNSNYTFKQLGWDTSVTLNGYTPSHTLYIPLSNYMPIRKAIAHVIVSFSPHLKQQTQLEIRFNQTLLRRIALPQQNNESINLDIELPLTELSADWQALKFTASLMGDNSLCSPDLWIYIAPESTINVTTYAKPFQGTLSQISNVFMNTGIINPIIPLLLIPQNALDEELFSLLQVAFRLGQLAPDSTITIGADYINEVDEEQKKQPLVLVSILEHLNATKNFNSLTSSKILDKALANNAGLILLNQSPLNPIYGVLTFTGATPLALKKAINAFLMPDFSKLASGQAAVINNAQDQSPQSSTKEWYQVSLHELNYTNQSVSGLGRHTISYSIQLPNDQIPKGATIKTYTTTPLASPKDYSRITVVMNGIKQFTTMLAQGQTAWTTQIDARAMKPGINTLEYLVDMHLEHEQCTLQNFDQVWTTIHAETTLDCSFSNEFPEAMLNQFPVPFNNEINIVLPDNITQKNLNNLTQLAFKLGQVIPVGTLKIHVLKGSQVDEAFIRSHNVILYGTANSNLWVRFALDYAPVQLNENRRSIQASKQYLELVDLGSTGLLELMPSPWTARKSVLIITGSDETGLSLAVNAFSNGKIRSTLNGNSAFINADKSIQVLKTNDVSYLNFKEKTLKYVRNSSKNILFYLTYHPQVLLYLLVFIVPLYIYIRRKKQH